MNTEPLGLFDYCFLSVGDEGARQNQNAFEVFGFSRSGRTTRRETKMQALRGLGVRVGMGVRKRHELQQFPCRPMWCVSFALLSCFK